MSNSSHFFPPAAPATPAPVHAAALLARAAHVISAEAQALHQLATQLDPAFAPLCAAMLAARRVVVSGMGKSGHVARKLAATLAASGSPAAFLHPAEAAHGDLGMLMRGDFLLLLSNSGHTAEVVAMVPFARRLRLGVGAVVGQAGTPLAGLADVALVLPPCAEACAHGHTPTVSTALQMALGDALAMVMMDQRGVGPEQLRALHPGGALSGTHRPNAHQAGAAL